MASLRQTKTLHMRGRNGDSRETQTTDLLSDLEKRRASEQWYISLSLHLSFKMSHFSHSMSAFQEVERQKEVFASRISMLEKSIQV